MGIKSVKRAKKKKDQINTKSGKERLSDTDQNNCYTFCCPQRNKVTHHSGS